MNQIVHMFQESNRRMKRISCGTYPLELVAAEQREFEGQIKLINTIIQAHAVIAKSKRAEAALRKMNIMDEENAVDLGLNDPETEKVKCPSQNKVIHRADCLDYSGSHYDECSGCEIGVTTKAMLLPEK